VAFRKKVYDTPDALQADLDAWMVIYNEQRTHQGRWCFGKSDADISRQRRLGERRQGSIQQLNGSFNPADTHHARSMARQVKYKLLHV
jgi:hypothetical protein